jgi:hypothetical protein
MLGMHDITLMHVNNNNVPGSHVNQWPPPAVPRHPSCFSTLTEQQGRQCSIVPCMSIAAVESCHLRPLVCVCVWRCAGAAHHHRLPLAITVARPARVSHMRLSRVLYCTCLSAALSSERETESGRGCLLNARTERAGRKWVRALDILVAGELRGRGLLLETVRREDVVFSISFDQQDIVSSTFS